MAQIHKEKFKLEPPEGGWGILVCIGMTLAFITPLGSMPSFALMFDDFLRDRGEQSSATAFITMSYFMAMSLAGLLSSPLFGRFSVRSVGIAGGTIFFLGTFLQIFIDTSWQLFITFSILQGAGFGLTTATAFTTFNCYFVRKRVMMMSIAQTMIGLGIMFYPLLIKELLNHYGFRGCLAINAAFNANCIFGMILMHPVKWHMRKVYIDDEENLGGGKENNGVDIQKELKFKANDRNELDEGEQPLLVENELIQNSNTNAEIIQKNQNNPNANITYTKSTEVKKLSGITDHIHCDIKNNLQIDDNVIDKKPKKKGLLLLIVDFLDLTLLKKPRYVNLALGVVFAIYSDVAFYTFQPTYIMSIGFSRDETAIIVAIGASADLVSRIVFAFVTAFYSISPRYAFLAGAAATILTRCVFLNLFDLIGITVITAILGVVRTWMQVTLPLVFSEYLPQERFPSGFGLFMFLQGNIMFMVGPIVGYLRDRTNSFHVAFHILNIFLGLCVVPWIIEILYLKRKKKSTDQIKNLSN